MDGLPPAGAPRAAHVMEGDPLLSVERRAVHAVQAGALDDVRRGAHVVEGDPLLSVERRAAHARTRQAPADGPRGAHVMEGDPLLSVEHRAIHARHSEAPADALRSITVGMLTTPDMSMSTAATTPLPGAALDTAESAAAAALVTAAPDTASPVGVRQTALRDTQATMRAALATQRQSARAVARRRWRLIPLAGAAGAVVAGLGGGTAVAYIISQGSGSSPAITGGPITIAVTATTGSADLLPGHAGAAYFTLHNPASSSATFSQVASGATVVSDNTALCGDGYVSIAQTLPYTLPTPVTVSPGGTSGIQSIAGLVALAPNAPSACQGVTFTVTFTLSGGQS